MQGTRVIYWALLFLYLGIVSVTLFAFNVYFPVFVSVIFLAAISIFFAINFYKNRIGILMPLMWLICALPFIHIIPYMWLSYEDGELIELWWGLILNPYMQSQQVIELTGMIGVVAGFGFAFGCSFFLCLTKKDDPSRVVLNNQVSRYLSFMEWSAWVLAGVLLSWLSAPRQDIFEAVYTMSDSMIQNLNFASAWTISYVVLTFGFCDAILDENKYRRKWKIRIFLYAITYIVIVLQLMRGDRESLPLVIGLLLVYFYWSKKRSKFSQVNHAWIKWMVAGLLLMIISMVVGVMRSELVGVTGLTSLAEKLSVGVDTGGLGFVNLLRGTWTGVALTPLSVAGDDIYEPL